MVSPVLARKISQTRLAAKLELPKARLCAGVVLAYLDSEEALAAAVVSLKQGLGSNWSPITALQFMSGRRGEFAADEAEDGEKVPMMMAHLIAKDICSNQGLGGVLPASAMDFQRLREASIQVMRTMTAP